jgi:hypothetical protein
MTTESVKSIHSYLNPLKRRQAGDVDFCMLSQTTKETSLCLQQQQVNILSFKRQATKINGGVEEEFHTFLMLVIHGTEFSSTPCPYYLLF